MFDNLSRTLSLLRDLSGKSQIDLAKAAKIGKSQLSKYETGKELPKFDSLEKVLNALGIGYSEFFYALRLVDRLSSEMPEIREAEASSGQPLFPTPPSEGAYLLPENTRLAFGQIFTDLLLLHHRMIEETVFPAAPPETAQPAESRPKRVRRKRRSSQRAAASSPPRSASPR